MTSYHLAGGFIIAVALFIAAVPICAGILNNRAAASAVAKLRADGVFLHEDDPAWVAREAEWEALGIAAAQRERRVPTVAEVEEFAAASDRVRALVEIAAAARKEATDAELWRLIEEAR